MTLTESLNTGCLSLMLAEALTSNIITNLFKKNKELMDLIQKSLNKVKYSIQGLADEFITEMPANIGLSKITADKVLKIWMHGENIAFFSVGNLQTVVNDANINWKTGNVNPKIEKAFGDKDCVIKALCGVSWDRIDLSKVYMIPLSSLKANGEGKQPIEIVDPTSGKMKSLKGEATNKKSSNPVFNTPLYDVCFKIAKAGKFTRTHPYSKFNISPIINWLKENRKQLSEHVNCVLDFALALDKRSKDVEKIYNAGKKKGYLVPTLTSDGSNDGTSNLKKVIGLAQAITYLIWVSESNYLQFEEYAGSDTQMLLLMRLL